MSKGDVKYVALGVKTFEDGAEHVICCGVFDTKGAALTALEEKEMPHLKRNIISVFEGLSMFVNVFKI